MRSRNVVIEAEGEQLASNHDAAFKSELKALSREFRTGNAEESPF